MTQINWGIAAGPTAFDNALAKGVQMGQMVRQRQDEKEKRNALATYATNPSEEGLAGLAPHVPEFVIAERQRMAAAQQQQQTQQREQRRADLPMLGRLLEHAAQGPEQWQQALGIAQQYGIDLQTAGVPPSFNPQWAMTQSALLKAIQTDEGRQALSIAGKLAADMGFTPGTPEHAKRTEEIFLADAAKPYTGGQGETRLYIPQLSGGKPVPPQPGTVVGGYTFKGGNPNDRNSWEPVGQGGPTQPASGNFRP